MPAGPYLHFKTITLAADGDGLEGNKREAGRPVMGRVQHCRWEMMLSLTREVTVAST